MLFLDFCFLLFFWFLCYSCTVSRYAMPSSLVAAYRSHTVLALYSYIKSCCCPCSMHKSHIENILVCAPFGYSAHSTDERKSNEIKMRKPNTLTMRTQNVGLKSVEIMTNQCALIEKKVTYAYMNTANACALCTE